MNLTTAIYLSLLVGLGLFVLGLIEAGNKAMRERDWAEGRETPPECLPSNEAKEGLKWFFVVWGVTAAFFSILDYIEPSGVEGHRGLFIIFVLYAFIFCMGVLHWAFRWGQTLGWPVWRLPAEIAAIGGVVFLAIQGIGWAIHWGVRLAGGGLQFAVFVVLGLPLGLFALMLALWIVVSPILGLTHLARFVRGKLRKRPHAGEGAGPPSIPKA
jgi:hypothetical protein